MSDQTTSKLLKGKVALVAGATRGAGRGIALELGAAGAMVYVTGRSTRRQRSEYNRVETIEETADLIKGASGQSIAVPTDHLDPTQVESLVTRINNEQGRLDILVNNIWGGELLTEWHTPIWKHSLEKGLRLLRLAIDTHLITSHFALPLLIKNPDGLLIEMTDGTEEYNRINYRLSVYYDLAKNAVNRLGWTQAQELAPYQCTSVSLTPGWMRSEMMLEHYDVTEENWRDALAKEPHFAISETTHFVGRAVVYLAQDPHVSRWNGQSLSSGQLARIYNFTDLDGSQPDAWRYLREVQDAGKPADVTGYR
jgi:NAD(P)-dependent dehydrogenase (short-subunit alcohol dehydrogenase family)